MSALNFKQFFHIWTQQLLNWLTVKFNSIDIDTSDLAKEAKATSNKNEILSKIENTQPDLSTVAKQGSNASATLTATQAAVVDGNDTSVSVSKEIRSEVGTGSDTASETGTLSAVLKWTKNKVKDIYTAVTGITGYALQGSDSTKSITSLDADLGDVAAALEYMQQGGMPQIAQIAKQGSNANANISEIQAKIGTPATGQPSDLFAAIAAGGGGGGDAQESTSQEILAAVQSIIGAHIINNIDYSGYVFVNGYTPTGFGDIFARCDMLYSITDENITIIDARYYTWGCRNLHSVNMQNLKVIGLTAACPAFSGCTSLIDVNLPNLEQVNGGVFQGVAAQELSFPKLKTVIVSGGSHSNCFLGCTYLRKLSMPNLESISAGNTFNSDVNLIDIICGAKFTTNMGFGTWYPTNALDASSSSLVEPGETFANNREKLLYNIREHIAANLPDRTGLSALTITFSSAVKAAINADTATAQAFSNKNWTIA